MLSGSNLSKQEQRIVILSGKGLSDKDIAVETGLALSSVRTYWKRIRQKCGLPSRSAVIASFLRESHPLSRSKRRRGRTRIGAAQIAFESAPDGLFVLTSECVCLHANGAAGDLLGKSPEELRGADISAFFVKGQEVDAQQWQSALRGESIRCQIPIVRNDGVRVGIEWNSHPDPDTGFIVSVARRLEAQPA